MGMSKYTNTKANTNTDEFKFVEVEILGRVGTDKNYTEIAVGHYEKNGKAMSNEEKLYFMPKYYNKDGELRNSKGFSIKMNDVPAIAEMLTKFVNE